MARSNREFNGCDPRIGECRTEHIVGDFFHCLAKNPKCMYAYPAGQSCTYCLHYSKRMFEHRSFAGTHTTSLCVICATGFPQKKQDRNGACVGKTNEEAS
jgi:hypothetical protein